MKRVGYLFEQAFTKDNLYQAYLDASKHKHGNQACFKFERRLSYNLDSLYDELQSGTYRPQPYLTFTVYEPKERKIYAPAFRDLVVQHAIYRVIRSIFDRAFIDQSYACRKGKGTHACANYAQAALIASPADSYTLKLDIRKFFYRINRDVLRRLIECKIKDTRFVDVMMLFADYGEPIGIPIGNLLSQIYALVYLNPLDHFIKRELKAKRYCRYVDDFIIFGITRKQADEYLVRIIAFIKTLGLELSRFTIALVKRGVNFVGYRTWVGKRFIRKRSLFVFSRALRAGKIQSVISILGHARRTHSLRYLVITMKEKCHDLQLPKAYRRFANG